MAEVEQTMAELATGQGTNMSQPIRPPNTRDNQINFPSWVHNNLKHNQFMGATTKDSHAHLTRFLQLCISIRLSGINDEHINLLLFLFFLGGGGGGRGGVQPIGSTRTHIIHQPHGRKLKTNSSIASSPSLKLKLSRSASSTSNKLQPNRYLMRRKDTKSS
ncbi:hypothetical protein AAZX31_05G089600 [Glycine max]